MKKFTLKHVFEGFRSTVQQPTAKPEQVSVVETLQQDNFQVAKVSGRLWTCRAGEQGMWEPGWVGGRLL